VDGSLYIGLMSGTSLDGVDAVLVRLPQDSMTGPGSAPGSIDTQVLGFVQLPFPHALRSELLALNASGVDELHRAALAANGVAQTYALAVSALLAQTGYAAREVTALGAHGQTVRHRPGEFDGVGYTLQLLNGALLAEQSGVAVCCDLRSRDLAVGGQGAPLVPAFHARCFGQPGRDVAVLNIGGMANLSLLPGEPAAAVRGFDCGPGNVLMDLWCQQARGLAYDAQGAWAASGRPVPALLAAALAEPFFKRPPPKSTGRDLFHAGWMADCLARATGPVPSAQDVQATWADLTVQTAITALAEQLPTATRLVVCGGGARNLHLMHRLSTWSATCLPALRVQASDDFGVPAEQVEALAFAWLAQALVKRQAGNLPAVTGARAARVLGAFYPA